MLLFVYAAFRPSPGSAEWTLSGLIAAGIVTTTLCLYFTVVSTLFSRDNLRHRLRSMSVGQIAGRLMAPWVATGVIGLVAAVWALAGYSTIVRRPVGPMGRSGRRVPRDYSLCCS